MDCPGEVTRAREETPDYSPLPCPRVSRRPCLSGVSRTHVCLKGDPVRNRSLSSGAEESIDVPPRGDLPHPKGPNTPSETRLPVRRVTGRVRVLKGLDSVSCRRTLCRTGVIRQRSLSEVSSVDCPDGKMGPGTVLTPDTAPSPHRRGHSRVSPLVSPPSAQVSGGPGRGWTRRTDPMEGTVWE